MTNNQLLSFPMDVEDDCCAGYASKNTCSSKLARITPSKANHGDSFKCVEIEERVREVKNSCSIKLTHLVIAKFTRRL